MARQEFIKRIAGLFNSQREAVECANAYADEELEKYAEEIISDLQDDFRLSVRENHLLAHGY